MPTPNDRNRSARPELRPTEARQGERGRPMLYVLIVGLVLAGAYIIGLMLWGQTDPGIPGTQQTQQGEPGTAGTGTGAGAGAGADGGLANPVEGRGTPSGIPKPPATEGVAAQPAPIEPVRPSPVDPTVRQSPPQ